MTTLRLALDWTPNPNHTGFFVAQELGYYADNGLTVTLVSPQEDDYAVTPAKKLELGQVDFAIAPFESVISLNTKANPVAAVAVAALLREDISSVAALASSSITRPRDLDGRTYASYQARYEDAIVRQLVRNDGGTGELRISYPAKLGIWDTLVAGAADATWIFDNWEGAEADTSGLALTKFRLADYGIPYAYSPVIASTAGNVAQHAAAYQSFLRATKKGFLFAVDNAREAAGILEKYLSDRDREKINILQSQQFTSGFYGDATTWGKMENSRVNTFLRWLVENKLEDSKIQELKLFTNKLLE